MTKTKALILPKKLTAYARSKTLGEQKEAFLAANLVKGCQEDEMPEHDNSVNSYFELGVEIRNTEFITQELVVKWKRLLEMSCGPSQSRTFINTTLARILGYKTISDLVWDVRSFSNKLPNPKFGISTSLLFGKNKSFNKNKALVVTIEFINSKEGVYHDGVCHGKFKADCVLATVEFITTTWSKYNVGTFNHNDFRRFVNTVTTTSEYTISRDWSQGYIAKLLGYESYQTLKELFLLSTTRVKFSRSLQEYLTLRQELSGLQTAT